MKRNPTAHFLVVGQGPSKRRIQSILKQAGLSDRLHFAGVLGDPLLPSAYASLDAFAFASESETQGMVLAEAMAARVPVVALDAPGAREVVRDGVNGRLLLEASHEKFADGLAWVEGRTHEERKRLRKAARETARDFSIGVCAGRTLEVYNGLLQERRSIKHVENSLWDTTMHMIATEWDLITNRIEAAGAAIGSFDTASDQPS
jgi:glycosyltransferase involved in cell wall biosynthesis